MSATFINTTPVLRTMFHVAPITWISRAWAANRQRRALLALDDSRLDDLGLTYRQARREATKPIWDVPAYWR